MGSGDFEQDVHDLNRRFGGEHSDRDVLADEHLRLALYRIAGRWLPVEQMATLLLADPDPGMADAVLVELIDEAAATGIGADFDTWSKVVSDAGVGRWAFPRKRIREWRLLISLDHPPSDGLADLISGSDWLQRSAAGRTNERIVLEALAERGRTKRVRSLAGERLRSPSGRRK